VKGEKGSEFFLPSQLRLLFRSLLPTSDKPFCAYPAEDEPHAHPLLATEVVPEPDYREDHGEHFAGDGYGDQEEGGEG
jgi:hypothetical protein